MSTDQLPERADNNAQTDADFAERRSDGRHHEHRQNQEYSRNRDHSSAAPHTHNYNREYSAMTDNEARQWGMFIHFGILAGYVIPLAGFIVPIVMWQMKKNDHELVDAHGKNVVNWLITAFLAGCVFFVLAFILIGIPLLWALGILNILFAIVGGLKANNGEVWAYPFTVRFLR